MRERAPADDLGALGGETGRDGPATESLLEFAGERITLRVALREGLTANRIEWIAGIINGTTNFILSEMRSKGLDFATVLKEAQRLGYAESDPTFDIEGVDAAHKLTIMSAIAFGVPVQFDKAHVEGISSLQATDIKYAEQLGYRIKLLGITRRRENGFELRVHPTLIPASRLIANVEGAMNAVVVQADAVGTTLYYGKGAGAEPTASAVVADLVDVTRLATADPEAPDAPDRTFLHDLRTHRPHGGGGAEHVVALEEARNDCFSKCQAPEHQGAVRHRLVTGGAGTAIQARDRTGDQLGGTGGGGQWVLQCGTSGFGGPAAGALLACRNLLLTG